MHYSSFEGQIRVNHQCSNTARLRQMSVCKKQKLTCAYSLYASPHYRYNFRDRQSYDSRSHGCLHTRETSDGAFDLKEGVKSIFRVWENQVGIRRIGFMKTWTLVDGCLRQCIKRHTFHKPLCFSFAAPDA